MASGRGRGLPYIEGAALLRPLGVGAVAQIWTHRGRPVGHLHNLTQAGRLAHRHPVRYSPPADTRIAGPLHALDYSATIGRMPPPAWPTQRKRPIKGNAMSIWPSRGTFTGWRKRKWAVSNKSALCFDQPSHTNVPFMAKSHQNLSSE